MNCNHCNKPLNEAQYHNDLKSCPNCSIQNGKVHVFYKYPDAFGKTLLRSTSKHPEGPQSYCTACRGGKGNTDYREILCSQK